MLQQLAKSSPKLYRHLSKITIAVATIGAALAVPVSGAAAAGSTTVYLDSSNPTDAASEAFCVGPSMIASTPLGCGNSVTAPVVLASGSSYTAFVTGAISAWGEWPYRRCGKPEPRSQFASPGISNGPAGDDAQFRFAVPTYSGKCSRPLPRTAAYFQVNLGSGWYHPIASGEPSKPSNDNTDKAHDQHPYSFTFVGQGVAPQFRYVDYHPSDNSGRFKIVLSEGLGTLAR